MFSGFDFARFMEQPKPDCPQAPRLRKLIAEVERDVRRKPKRAAEGMALIEAGKAHCIARCGGCELTREPVQPRKVCRRGVTARLRELADQQGQGRNVDGECSAVAANCRDCGRCPKFAAGISFMLLGPRPAP